MSIQIKKQHQHEPPFAALMTVMYLKWLTCCSDSRCRNCHIHSCPFTYICQTTLHDPLQSALTALRPSKVTTSIQICNEHGIFLLAALGFLQTDARYKHQWILHFLVSCSAFPFLITCVCLSILLSLFSFYCSHCTPIYKHIYLQELFRIRRQKEPFTIIRKPLNNLILVTAGVWSWPPPSITDVKNAWSFTSTPRTSSWRNVKYERTKWALRIWAN
jgi:hypothetical protein